MCSVMNRRACWPGSCHTSGLGRDCTCDAGFVTKTNSDGTVAHGICEFKPIRRSTDPEFNKFVKAIHIYLHTP